MSVRQMALVWELDVEDSEQGVLLVLADHADDEGKRARPSVSKIAWKTGLEERQVQRLLKSMVVRGWLVVEQPGGGRRATEYRLALGDAPRKMSFEEWRELPKEEQRRMRRSRKKRRDDAIAAAEVPPEIPRQNVTPQNRPSRAIPRQNVAAGVTSGCRGRGDIQMSGEPSYNHPEPSFPPDADASTPSGGSGSDSRAGEIPSDWPRLEEEAARLWMAEIAEDHPYLQQFAGPRRIAAKASLQSLIEARVPHIWTDATGRRVPWRVRPAAWELALGMVAREGGRLENVIRLVALPQLLDPFKVRSSSDIGRAPSTGLLSRIELPANLSAEAAARLREWASRSPSEAEALIDRMFADPKWGGNTKEPMDTRRLRAGQGFVVEAMPRARESA